MSIVVLPHQEEGQRYSGLRAFPSALPALIRV
jgi:hypothetical protein